jgi:uncharacterized protein (UPF0303 family)
MEELVALLREERELQFSTFTNADAWRLGVALIEAARAQGAAVTVDVRRGDQQLFHAALDGTSADNDAWIERKVRVVRRFGHSSFYVGTSLRLAQTTIREKFLLDEAEYAPHGGAFPIMVRGVGPVGVVTVSGLPQEEDHRLVVDVLREVLGRAGNPG